MFGNVNWHHAWNSAERAFFMLLKETAVEMLVGNKFIEINEMRLSAM